MKDAKITLEDMALADAGKKAEQSLKNAQLLQHEAPRALAYEPSRMLSSFYIAGFKNYDGCKVLGKLKVGKKLDLVAEPENPYDPNAVRVERKGAKLGYVPKDENALLSVMSFYGHADVFECRVQQVDAKADPWKQVRVGLYLKDAR